LKQTEKNALNLAFLDPEGLELEWNTVALLASVKRLDLIINYPQGGLNRLMPVSFESPNHSQIDTFFGGPEWRDIYHQYRGKRGLHRELMDLYKAKLHELEYQEVIRDDETGDAPLVRNAKEAPLYRLLFASKHPLGYDFWQKITRRDVHGQPRLF
jgi:three-Cys-motif partner protein